MPHDQLKADVDLAVARYFAELSRAAPRQAALGAETLRDIAATARTHLYQGARFLAAGMYDEAIHHLGQAARVMPDDLFTHVALSTAYLERYERQFEREDGQAAHRLAAICQALDPYHFHAFEVLRRLDAVKRERETLLRARLTLGAVIAGLLGAVAVFVEVVARG